jgi:hypothetical protein
MLTQKPLAIALLGELIFYRSSVLQYTHHGLAALEPPSHQMLLMN